MPRPVRAAIVVLLASIVAALALTAARAVEPIKISRDDVALDLSRAVEIYSNQGDTFQISTAPGVDGIVRRIEVEALDERSTGDWAVFALANNSDQQLDRPVLLLQGSDDRVVPPSQAEVLVAALEANRVPHRYLRFEGEGHGFRRASTIIAACTNRSAEGSVS